MFRFTVRIANQIIEINALYHQTHSFFKEFLAEGEPVFGVAVTKENLDFERKANKTEPNIGSLSAPSIEVLALHRIISNRLIDFNILLLHGAAVSVGNLGYVFCGNSGIGKSTHLLKWLCNIPEAREINGDKPFIIADKRPLVCGSPWGGKERLYTNTQIPLKSIILIERAKDNHIEQVPLSLVFPRLCQQILRPTEADKTIKNLHMLQSLEPAVTFWRFQCNNFKDDCFDVAYNALVKNQP